MAGGAQYGVDKSYKAAAAIGSAASGPDLATSYDYFLFVMPSGTAGDTVTVADAGATSTSIVLGVAQQRVATADINSMGVDVRILGISKVVLGTGGGAFGDLVQSDAAGKAVVTTTAGDRVAGRLLQGGVAGDVVDVLLTPCAQVGVP